MVGFGLAWIGSLGLAWRFDLGGIVSKRKDKPETPLPSGKFLQRVPPKLHAKLIVRAREDHISLNTLVTLILDKAV